VINIEGDPITVLVWLGIVWVFIASAAYAGGRWAFDRRLDELEVSFRASVDANQPGSLILHNLGPRPAFHVAVERDLGTVSNPSGEARRLVAAGERVAVPIDDSWGLGTPGIWVTNVRVWYARLDETPTARKCRRVPVEGLTEPAPLAAPDAPGVPRTGEAPGTTADS
jgi:hypothetical protein